ncbi:hypothetical protein Poli38472_000388 [Pythium oligandrum]|uniref:COPI associated protein n=1 Tax=Pythium oligandrum TaxID=41045 RepID=A0A8K1FFA4_PYTOL|nr:hypothetical protein Poli38472_000388 [Pythium oligandrum]|eukprot:TMW60346.1 hypothetical protein Poli38472_000388 [Pythium oligandrum]
MGAHVLDTARENLTTMAKYVRILNIVCVSVQVIAGVVSLFKIFHVNLAETLISVYVMLLAMLVLCYEFRFQMADTFIRTNFGFIYSFQGRSAYLLFIGLLDLGMANGFFGIAAGATACLTAVTVLATGYCAPEQFDQDKELPIIHEGERGHSRIISYGSDKATSPSVKSPPGSNTKDKKKTKEPKEVV